MKALIHQTSESSGSCYELYATATPHSDYVHLKFSSIWTGAKDPYGEQNKFEALLSKSDISILKQLLEDASDELV